MSAAVLREKLTARPFEPFRLRLSNGYIFEVRHPENAMLVRSGILVGVRDASGELPEVPTWCSFLHVAAVEPVESSRTPGGNGAGH